MPKYNFLKSRRNTTFWSKVGETGVGEQVLIWDKCSENSLGTVVILLHIHSSNFITI